MLYNYRLNALQIHILSSFCLALIQAHTDYSLEEIYEKLVSKNDGEIRRALQESILSDSKKRNLLSYKQRESIVQIFNCLKQENNDPHEILKLPAILEQNKRMSESLAAARRYLLEKKELEVRTTQENTPSKLVLSDSFFSNANFVLEFQEDVESDHISNYTPEKSIWDEDSFNVAKHISIRGSDSFEDLGSGSVEALERHAEQFANQVTITSRYLQADVPERAKFGDRFSLLVRIVLASGEGRSRLRSFGVPTQGLDVRVTVSSSGFTVVSESTQTLHVPSDTDSDPLLFELEARQPGIHKLEICAFNAGAFLGAHVVQITVDSSQTGPPVRQSSSVETRKANEGEATLRVEFDMESNRYRYAFHGDAGEYADTLPTPLARPREALIKDFVETLNAIARGDVQLSPMAARLQLIGKGRTLWKQIIPDELKRTFWDHKESIKQLRIICGPDPIPWEVLHPSYGDDDGDKFLAEYFPVTRWRLGPHPTRSLQISQPLFVLPDKSPDRAQAEISELKHMLKGGSLVENLDALLIELQAPQFNVLHFACHNTFVSNKPLASYIKMNGSPFTPDMVSGIGRKLSTRSPLIFMNACRTASSAPTYTQLSGWADTFLNAGAAAFIGSLWEIRDEPAPKFAASVYKALLSNETLGDSVKMARDEIYGENGDPTWLAYTVYGNPDATVVGE